MVAEEGGIVIVVVCITGAVAAGTVVGIMLAVAAPCGEAYAAGWTPPSAAARSVGVS